MTISVLRVITASMTFLAGTLDFPDCSYAGETIQPEPPTVAELMTRDIAGVANKEAIMITVAYLPGGASLPHRHEAQVFVYVLEGTMKMQVDGAAPVTIRPGQTFYEGPHDVHRVSANASQTEPVKILVFMIKDKGTPASFPLGPKGTP